MVSEEVTVRDPSGLYLKPTGVLCNKTIMFQSLITFKSDINFVANAKSVLGVLGICVKYGDRIEFVCEGDDEVEALVAMAGAVRDGLGEQDFQKSVIE